MNEDLDELAKAEVVERQPCPRCSALPGSPCRTHVGTVATTYHTGRYDKLPVLRSGPAVRVPKARQPGKAWQAGPVPDVSAATAQRPGDRIGYARVSGKGQDLTAQQDALRAAGCVRIYAEKISTRQPVRPEYTAALEALRPGDIFTVIRLDRLGRNLIELILSAQDLEARGNRLEILAGPLAGIYDPNGGGKLLFVLLATMAEMEREFIRERTMDGLAVAEAQGKRGGRPRAVDGDALAVALARRAAGEPVPAIARHLGIGRSTLYRALESYEAGGALRAEADHG